MKKFSSLTTSFFILLFLFLFTASCKKNVENRIEGKWRRINVVNATSDTFEDWEFNNGYLVILQHTVSGSTTIDTVSYALGEYSIKANPFRKKLIISKFNTTTNGSVLSYITDWTIQKLTKKYLTIYTTTYGGKPGGQEYREFTRL